MTDLTTALVTAVALMLVIEGSLYALFPDLMRRVLAMAPGLPIGQLRLAGVLAVGLGVGIVWVVRG